MIIATNISKQFKGSDKKAVENVSFQIETGQIASLIGTSGCGKTTTLKMINRLVEPTSGSIQVNDKYSKDLCPVEWRRQIGYVVQKAGLLPHMNVEKNISLLSILLKKNKKEIEKRVQELMELVDLPYAVFSKRFPRELSGGQQQRVGIARALMEDPEVLLMDEPFGALDPITRNSLHDEILRLNQLLRKTILIVTHDMSEAFKLSDKVLLMNEGKLLFDGAKDKLLNDSSNEFVKNFLKDHVESL